MPKKTKEVVEEKELVPEVAIPEKPVVAPKLPMMMEVLANLPLPEKPIVSLRIFSIISGVPKDQFAGFLAYARLNNLEPRTVEEWRSSYTEFLNKPVK